MIAADVEDIVTKYLDDPDKLKMKITKLLGN